jgi:hypothetical protein
MGFDCRGGQRRRDYGTGMILYMGSVFSRLDIAVQVSEIADALCF